MSYAHRELSPFFLNFFPITNMIRFIVFFVVSFFPYCLMASSQIDELIDKGEFDLAVELAAKDKKHYLSELNGKAKELNLSNNAIWLALGHYKKNIFGKNVSQVDGEDFFFSSAGKFDSKKELMATLASFFSERRLEPNKLSAQCRFVARYYWLNQQLKFDESRLKKEKCKDYDLYLHILAPEKLTVVFPTTHPNSPSSMFGHTLLRVDKKGQTEQTKMLNYSVNYAAQVTPTTSSLSYSILGLTGGFPGKFSVVPYYSKLREYSQMENRDVWEYTLNMSSEKIDFILMHIYELSPSYFDYYFFTENCSYHLLSLLDVSYPENRFTDQFNGWTIPIDTLRLLRDRNLVSDIKYYPSHARIIKAKQKVMIGDDLILAGRAFNEGLDIHKTEIEKLNDVRQIQILDLLNDYYRFNKLKQSEHSASKLNRVEREVLLMRSKIKKPSTPPEIVEPSIKPDLGHGSSRISLGASRLSGENSVSLHWRPAYHDLLDPSAGFTTNSSLEFMNVGLSYDISQEKLKVKDVTVLDIFSLEARDGFFSNVSWRLSTGWKKQAEFGVNNLSFFEIGGGPSYALTGDGQTLVYGLLGATLQYGEGLNKSYRTAPEARLGLVSEYISRWRIHAYLKSFKGIFGDTSTLNVFVFQQSFAVSKNVAVNFGVERAYKGDLRSNEYNVAINYYF